MSVMPPGSRSSSPRWAAGCSVAARLGDRVERHVELDRHRRRRQHVREVAESRAAASRRATLAGGVRERRRRAVEAAVLDVTGADVGRGPIPNVTTRPANRSARAHDSRASSALATSTSSAPRLLEDLGLGVGDRVGGREEAQVRVADVGPHAHVGLGDADERADLPGVIHAQFDHRHLRPGAQLEQRERQADVVVQIALVPKHRVARRQELRGDLLRRRLARAAGDRHDLRARSPAHVARDVLQRARRVGDLDHDSGAGRCRSCLGQAGVAVTTAPAAPAASASATNSWPSNRSPRIATNRSPAASVRESIDDPLDRRRPVARAPPRPPVAAAISAAVSASGSTRYDTREPAAAARQRGARHLDVVERQRPIADDLVLLVPLAGDEHEIAGPRLADRRSIAALPIDDREVRRRLRPGWPFGATRSAGMTMPRLISSMICSGPRGAGCRT